MAPEFRPSRGPVEVVGRAHGCPRTCSPPQFEFAACVACLAEGGGARVGGGRQWVQTKRGACGWSGSLAYCRHQGRRGRGARNTSCLSRYASPHPPTMHLLCRDHQDGRAFSCRGQGTRTRRNTAPCRLLPAAEWLGVNRGWGGGWGWQGCLVVAGLREGVAGVAGGGTSRLAKTVRACARASRHDGDGGLFLLGPFHDDGAPGQARVHYPRARMPRYSNPSRFRGRRDAAQTQRGV